METKKDGIETEFPELNYFDRCVHMLCLSRKLALEADACEEDHILLGKRLVVI